MTEKHYTITQSCIHKKKKKSANTDQSVAFLSVFRCVVFTSYLLQHAALLLKTSALHRCKSKFCFKHRFSDSICIYPTVEIGLIATSAICQVQLTLVYNFRDKIINYHLRLSLCWKLTRCLKYFFSSRKQKSPEVHCLECQFTEAKEKNIYISNIYCHYTHNRLTTTRSMWYIMMNTHPKWHDSVILDYFHCLFNNVEKLCTQNKKNI